MDTIRIGGMLVGYYIRCPRQAWLSLNGLGMEQESEDVALGRLIDKAAHARLPDSIDLEAQTEDGIHLVGRIDRADLRDGVLYEIKKSLSAKEAHLWQTRFYLWLLRLSGITRPNGTPYLGLISYPVLRRTVDVTLEDAHVARLEQIVRDIHRLAGQPTPPPRIPRRKLCARCAFEELCYG